MICGLQGGAYTARLKQRDDCAENERNDQAGQHVHGLAVLDAKDRQAGAKDEEAADDRELRHHVRRHECAEGEREQIDAALPAEKDDGRQRHADAIGGGEHHGGDEIQRGVREQIGVIAIQGALDGTEDGKRADTEKQNAG